MAAIRPLLALPLVLVALPTIAQTPAERAAAIAGVEAFQANCRADDGRLWGVTLCGPLIVVDGRTGLAVATAKPPAGSFAAERGVWIGRVPEGMQVANTAIEWEGALWSTVRLPLPGDAYLRDKLIAHEAFHRVQQALGLNARDAINAHLDEEDGRVLLRLELRALTAAATAVVAATVVVLPASPTQAAGTYVVNTPDDLVDLVPDLGRLGAAQQMEPLLVDHHVVVRADVLEALDHAHPHHGVELAGVVPVGAALDQQLLQLPEGADELVGVVARQQVDQVMGEGAEAGVRVGLALVLLPGDVVEQRRGTEERRTGRGQAVQRCCGGGAATEGDHLSKAHGRRPR